MSPRPGLLVLVVMLLAIAALALPGPVQAYDPNEVWRKGTWVLSMEGAYGSQINPEGHRDLTGIEFVEIGARWSLLPFDIIAPGSAWRSAFEIGLEPVYLHYLHPDDAYFAGLGLVARWHFLGLARFVPYIEVGGGVGGTNLNISEIDSDFAFLVFGGVGASYFITDRHALYAGWRWTHNSNAGIEQRNRGWDASTAVVGVSIFLK